MNKNQGSTIFCPQETHFSFKYTHGLEVNWGKKITTYKWLPKDKGLLYFGKINKSNETKKVIT